MTEFKKNDEELGALWIKQSARGEFMTGTIGDQKVVVFRNDKKTSDRQPDYRVLKARPIEPRDTQPQWRDLGGGFTSEGHDVEF